MSRVGREKANADSCCSMAGNGSDQVVVDHFNVIGPRSTCEE